MKKILFISIISLIAVRLLALNSVQDSILLKDVVIHSPKDVYALKNLPVTYYSMGLKCIESKQIGSLKDISLFVPNFYIPDYGSKITSSIYVRGIGSRMNEPSVALYIDDIPYLDKSGFDFDFYDIQSLKFLQGPQGTLYGRNAIGGLLNIYTISPLYYQGTRINFSYGNYNDIKVGLSHYKKINEKLGVSFSAYYKKNDGYFINNFDGEKNSSESSGGRLKLEWKLTDKWKASLNVLYDHVSQQAYPYAGYDTLTLRAKEINYNEDGSYLRDVFGGGLSFQREGKYVLFTSATGFQYLTDRMLIDQDFTSDSIFSLKQKQKIQSLTQELVFRSKNEKPYQWVSGLFAFYKGLEIASPMTFRSGGIDMLQGYMDAAKIANPAMPTITILNREMNIPGDYENPILGCALYHESTYNFSKKFSVTGGIRFDYETTKINYNTSATLQTSLKVSPSPYVPLMYVDSTYSLNGTLNNEFWQVLPKLALKYDFTKMIKAYASVSKGYKAGGYNYAMFSDVLQSQIQKKPEVDIEKAIRYEPEYLWNYELGTHLELLKDKLFSDIALFYIDDNNQQMVTSISNGSRVITNAEKVQSYGLEAVVRANVNRNLLLNAAYGYTCATFKKYSVDSVSYSGKKVPFVPENTLSIGVEYNLNLNKKYLDKIIFGIQYAGVGKIYWNEKNSLYQDFYQLLNGEISFSNKSFTLTTWIKNALNQDYNTFYFESLRKSFVQKGLPVMCGVNIRYSF
ncbi:MAG: TonB-dependent receptor [Paludibacteraceae bacterium]|nr:TonB-dependent receptor [Paludibacteraceae bacterium]MBN2788124.1 TonB-dependent receptor [Paludibacteraceae bacterium]